MNSGLALVSEICFLAFTPWKGYCFEGTELSEQKYQSRTLHAISVGIRVVGGCCLSVTAVVIKLEFYRLFVLQLNL